MNKAELDLKRDQLIPSSSAVSRLQELHQLMNSSLLYTKRLVSFMVFDTDFVVFMVGPVAATVMAGAGYSRLCLVLGAAGLHHR